MSKQQNEGGDPVRKMGDQHGMASEIKKTARAKTDSIDIGKNQRVVKGRFAERLAAKWVKEHFPHLELVGTNLHFSKFGEIDLVFSARSMCNVDLNATGPTEAKGGNGAGVRSGSYPKFNISRETKYTFYAFEIRSQYCSCVGLGMQGRDRGAESSTCMVDSGYIYGSDKYNSLLTSAAPEFNNTLKYSGIYGVQNISTNNMLIRDGSGGVSNSIRASHRCLRCKSIRPITALKKRKLLTSAKLLRLKLMQGESGDSGFSDMLKNINFGSRETLDIDIVSMLIYLRIDLNGNNLMFDSLSKNARPATIDSLPRIDRNSSWRNIYYRVELFKLGSSD